MHRNSFSFVVTALALVVTTFAPRAVAQDIDAMAKWTSLTVVHYKVVGEFSGDTLIVSGGALKGRRTAKVTDRVEIEFDWDQTEMQLTGKPPVIVNFPTKLVSLNPMDGCPLPRVKGTAELMTASGLKSDGPMRYSGIISLETRGEWPAGEIPHLGDTGKCGETWDPTPARSEAVTAPFQVVVAMSMAMPGGAPYALTADKKSLVFKTGSWTWTYTPTPVK